jgi:DNA repair protein RecN (Recombination protein N)
MRLDGLLSSTAVVEQALQQRLAFYGQLEHTRLLQLDQQLKLLDGAAPEELGPALAAYTAAYDAARALAREYAGLRETSDERRRELDLLRFQVDEIDAARLEPAEEQTLARERERLRHAGKLLERAGGALALLDGEEQPAATDSVRAAQRLVADAAALDDTLAAAADRLDGLSAELDDVAEQLRTYVETLDVDPASRDTVELRYDKVKALLRKYGATADDVLAYAERARARLAQAESSAADEEHMAVALQAAQAHAVAAAVTLSAARRRVAPELTARVQAELRLLAMPHAVFTAELSSRGADWQALGPSGADDVEFLFSANLGVPPRPLRETASGGELSRAMLALRGIVTLNDDVETLVFDEVDQGIGGVTAAAVGERLARLAARRQVLCITHLPQVAAYAERHFAIVKESDAQAGTTQTSVGEVSGEAQVAELCRMLGAAADDRAAREHALGLLARAGRAL